MQKSKSRKAVLLAEMKHFNWSVGKFGVDGVLTFELAV